MLECLSWLVERIESKYYNLFFDVFIFFVVCGDVFFIYEGEKFEILNSFLLLRRCMGNSLKEFYFFLEDRSLIFEGKIFLISSEKESFVFGIFF